MVTCTKVFIKMASTSGNSFPPNTFNSFYLKISLESRKIRLKRRKIEIQKAFKVINRNKNGVFELCLDCHTLENYTGKFCEC